MEKILCVRDLFVELVKNGKKLVILSGINVEVGKDETLCIVGESGCGKTVFGLSILRLLPKKFYINGSVLFKERDLLKLDLNSMRKIRGKDISMVFQDPMTSLNPLFKVGDQIKEVLDVHQIYDPSERVDRVFDLLREVGLPPTKEFYNRYPHQLSGGQKQRIMIAMAVACNPLLLIADEPTTALDVTVQAQILNLFKKVKESHGSSLIYITHDLNLVRYIADRIMVMYMGSIVEEAETEVIFRNPLHPYTRGLLEAMPSLDKKDRLLKSIPGSVPSFEVRPAGCVFSTRCNKVQNRCLNEEPDFLEVEEGHFVRCFYYGD